MSVVATTYAVAVHPAVVVDCMGYCRDMLKKRPISKGSKVLPPGMFFSNTSLYDFVSHAAVLLLRYIVLTFT